MMDENLPLKVTHDVSQTLQRKLEGWSIQLPIRHGIAPDIPQVLQTLSEHTSTWTTRMNTTSMRSTSLCTKLRKSGRSRSASKHYNSCSRSKRRQHKQQDCSTFNSTASEKDVFWALR